MNKKVDLSGFKNIFEDLEKETTAALKKRVLGKEFTSEELKALLDKSELTAEEVHALSQHIADHLPPGSGSALCCVLKGKGSYEAVGGLSGHPGAAALACATLQGKLLDRLNN